MAGRGEISTLRTLDDLCLVEVRQNWAHPRVGDVESAVLSALAEAGALERIQPGQRIAITAGSRGIAALPAVLRRVAGAVRERGGAPFLFPAMGSHGGGTAEGQTALLYDLGISESTIDAPIRATMEVVSLGEIPQGVPVFLDAYAAEAEGIIMVNRIKKHTNFDAALESGLCKMAVIGMGKHRQAVELHQYGNRGFREYLAPIAAHVFSRAPVLAGLALIENARGELAEVTGVAARDIVAREPSLLARAKALCAKIPFKKVDIALVEWMGKEVSGTGMDCYVIGRRYIAGEPEWTETPSIHSLVVLDLTEESHGNAIGIGLADFTTRRLADKIDWGATYTNVMTSGNPERAKLPIVMPTDRAALEAAAFRERIVPLAALRLVALRDTLHLERLLVSEALLTEVRAQEHLEIVGEPRPFPFAGDDWRSPFV